jgi:hypothetical protein
MVFLVQNDAKFCRNKYYINLFRRMEGRKMGSSPLGVKVSPWGRNKKLASVGKKATKILKNRLTKFCRLFRKIADLKNRYQR